MSRRPLLTASLLAATAGVAVPAVAHADPPEVTHGNFEETFENVDVCGIDVDVHAQGVRSPTTCSSTTMAPSSGSRRRRRATQTFTADNGKSVIVQNAGQFADTDGIIDKAAGTITFVYTYKGLPEQIRTAHGPVLVHDAGVITFADTFDLETGDFISSEVLVSNGPHPEADSNFELFCEVITSALS